MKKFDDFSSLGSITLMALKVNLDALIEKEDFTIVTDEDEYEPTFNLDQLASKTTTFGLLRKPAFQRSTSDWSPQQVVDLIKNFIDGDLIPAIIIWNSPSRLQFVMDGAHRLSALIAWVNDDYGDGTISQRRAGGSDKISQAQKKAHDATKKLVEKEIGSYDKLYRIGAEIGSGTPLEQKRARGMGGRKVEVQTYRKANARQAEISFYKINQGATPLSNDEREVIKTRYWPESIAAHAIWRSGNGKRYTVGFSTENERLIDEMARVVRSRLTLPDYDSKQSPMAIPVIAMGNSNSDVGLFDQFIHLANKLPERKRSPFAILEKDDPKNDTTGDSAVAYLKRARKIATAISSNEAHSFGLHPGIYCYSNAGKFLSGAFFAMVLLVRTLVDEDRGYWFTAKRKRFEDFIWSNKDHLSHLTHQGGSKMKSANPILKYWMAILGAIENELQISDYLNSQEEYKILSAQSASNTHGRKISRGAKDAMALRDAVRASHDCPECGAKIYSDAWTRGHIEDSASGGSGHSSNLLQSHPYCNSGYRTRLQHQSKSTSGKK